MSNGILLLVFAVILIGLLPTFIAVLAAMKEADPLDERQAQIRGKAYRDTVIVMFVCYFLSAVWSGLRKEAGFPEVATAPAMLCLITMTGLSFYMANCIVRDIAFGKEKINKEVLRSFWGGYSICMITSADAARDFLWRDNAAEPADWFLLFRFGFFIFGAFQLIALIIRLCLDRKEASEEG